MNLAEQLLLLYVFTAANAYADGMRARALLRAQFGCWWPNWTASQWTWHVCKWIYFNVPLFYISRFCWKWDLIFISVAALTFWFFWLMIYYCDWIYKPWEKRNG